jgi:hypothetical protein
MRSALLVVLSCFRSHGFFAQLSNQIRDKTQERNELTIEMWDRAKGGQRAAPVKDGPPSHDLLALAKDISRLKERRLKAAIDLRDLQQLAADLEGSLGSPSFARLRIVAN